MLSGIYSLAEKHTLSRRKRTSCNSFVLAVDMTAHLAVYRREGGRVEREGGEGGEGGRGKERKGCVINM